MKTGIVRSALGSVVALALFAGGQGLAHADVVLGTSTSGGQTCTDYMDEHGHIYQLCHALLDPRHGPAMAVEPDDDTTAQKLIWVQHNGLNWPLIVEP